MNWFVLDCCCSNGAPIGWLLGCSDVEVVGVFATAADAVAVAIPDDGFDCFPADAFPADSFPAGFPIDCPPPLSAGAAVPIKTWRPAGILLGRAGPMGTSLVASYHGFEALLGAWGPGVPVPVAVLDIPCVVARWG